MTSGGLNYSISSEKCTRNIAGESIVPCRNPHSTDRSKEFVSLELSRSAFYALFDHVTRIPTRALPNMEIRTMADDVHLLWLYCNILVVFGPWMTVTGIVKEQLECF